jgi:cell division protein FtsZ
MARKRASMREGPLAELFRATEAAQRQAERQEGEERSEPVSAPEPEPVAPEPEPEVELPPAAVAPPPPAPTAPAVEYTPPAYEPEPESEPVAETVTFTRPEPVAEPEAPVERETRWVEPLPEQPPRLWAAPRADSSAYLAAIRVVGVGGAGLNALDRMIDAGITGVEFVAVNTDIQQLQMSDAPVKIHIGRELTEGLGSGADPEVGRPAAAGGV